MHPKHVGPVDNNLQYTKFPNAAHFLDMVVLWDPLFIIYNTPPWMTTHKEYASLKPCQRKTQWDKNQWRRKKSTVFL
jgi:hypothetical protein